MKNDGANPQEKPLRKRLYRISRIVLIEVAIVLLIVTVLFLSLSRSFYRAKYRAGEMHLTNQLSAVRAELRAQPQFENHTCGYHALAAIYQSFGLDERKANLRFRLGVDEAATPLSADDTAGTLHPDILRVVSQDGFAVTVVELERTNSVAQIVEHLKDNGPAMVLISRRENDRLHWVVFTESDGVSVKVADSLRSDDDYREELIPFLREHVLSVILLQPGDPTQKTPSVSGCHRKGLQEMVNVYERLRARQKPVR